MATLKEAQIAVVKRMLLLNQDVGDAEQKKQATIWKVLVYDRQGRDIISPLLKVGELRKLGITVHMMIDADRQPIPDVPAIYFVAPTEENLKRIAADANSRLYDDIRINFTSAVSSELLDKLAEMSMAGNSVSAVSSVHDQYSNFVSLESNLADLAIPNSYAAMNDPSLSDQQVEKNIDDVVAGLFSVLVTMNAVPIIRCPRGEAAEMVAQRLDGKIRESLQSRNSLFDDSNAAFAQQRPLLVILDRNIDLSVPLHHPWTYQALIHDMLELRLNRVTIQPLAKDGAQGQQQQKSKTYDLDLKDEFWAANASSPFPKVGEEVENQLQKYKEKIEQVNRLSSSFENPADPTGGHATKELASAIDSLPMLTEKKKHLDMHTTIATRLLDGIKDRKLDTYFGLEEAIMGRSSLDHKEMMQLLESGGTPADKLRLFLIYFLGTDSVAPAELQKLEAALEADGCDMAPVVYAKHLKQMKAFQISSSSSSSATGTLGHKKVQEMGENLSSFLGMAKNLVVSASKKDYPVTRIVDALMDLKSSAGVENYMYLDPKVVNVAEARIPRTRAQFKDAIVFVIGGGNYIEFQNLQDYVRGTQKSVTYAATEIYNAAGIIQQLSMLGGMTK